MTGLNCIANSKHANYDFNETRNKNVLTNLKDNIGSDWNGIGFYSTQC